MRLSSFVATAKRHLLTVYPDGEINVTCVKEAKRLVEDLPKYPGRVNARNEADPGHCEAFKAAYIQALSRASALGLSKVSKNHTNSKRRGTKGITASGKRKVRNTALLIERIYGRSRCSFLTLTLHPSFAGLPGTAYQEACRIFLQWLKRRLIASGLPALIVGCTEVQEKRFQSSGIVALHEHLVFVGRKPNSTWVLTPSEIATAWHRACESAYGISVDLDAKDASINVQRVKKSVSAYLGKYLSKGTSCLNHVIQADKGDALPGKWYTLTREALKLFVESVIKRSDPIVTSLFDALVVAPTEVVRWSRHLYLPGKSGQDFWVAWIAFLTPRGYLELKSALAQGIGGN